jgi:uncharacterized protein with beta-barrel porin domain
MNRPELPVFMFEARPCPQQSFGARHLCAIAFAVFMIAAPVSAQECGNTSGTEVFDSGTGTVTCSGNQSPGISATALNVTVEDLTSNIAPLSGLAGITVEGSNFVVINSTLGAFSIITNGFEAHGIDVVRQQGMSIIHSGEISSMGDGSNGISARATQGEISIDASGNIAVGNVGAGIFANTRQGTIAISHVGNIMAGEQSSGIYAVIDQDGDGQISIASRGNITLTGSRDASPLGPAAGIAAFGYGDITINSTGDITTTGEARHGIFATTEPGNVSITSAGNIAVDGFNASGIYVNGGGHNTVLISSGKISSNDSTAAAIFFESNDFGLNTLENHGTIAGQEHGYAVFATGAAPTSIQNYGTITGNINLTPDGGDSSNDANIFNNMQGALFNSGENVELDGSGTLNNRGTISPGGSGVVATTTIGGNFAQTRTGLLAADIDPRSGASDSIVVRGAAALSGAVLPRLLSLKFSSLEFASTILSASAVANNGLTVSDTALVDYSLLYPNATDVVLAMHVSFDAPGLTPNQSSILDYFGRGAAGDDPEIQTILLALLNAPNTAAVAAITDQLYSNAAGSAVSSALQFGDALAASLRSCPVADGTYGNLREASCLWAKPTYRQFSQDKGTDRAQIADDTSGISGGFQTALSENIWGGLGFSLEESNTHVDHRTRVDGTWWQLGGAAKWTQGPWKLSGSLSGGQADLDTVRSINIPGLSAIASSGTDTGFVTGLARLAYAFGDNSFYVTPMLNMGFTFVDIDGFTESGAGALNLEVASASETIFSAGPAVEIGATITAESLTFRPYAKFGLSFLSGDNIATVARFASAPETIAPFTTQTRFDDVSADISAGVQWFSTSGINLRLNYDGRFGDYSEQHGVDAKLTVNY